MTKSQSEPISAGTNTIEFVFETPVEEVKTDIEVSMMENSKPAIGKFVTISYSGNQYAGSSQMSVACSHRVDVVAGDTCTISVPDYESQSKVLQETAVNVFPFPKDFTHPEPPVEPVKFSPYIRSKGTMVSLATNILYLSNIME